MLDDGTSSQSCEEPWELRPSAESWALRSSAESQGSSHMESSHSAKFARASATREDSMKTLAKQRSTRFSNPNIPGFMRAAIRDRMATVRSEGIELQTLNSTTYGAPSSGDEVPQPALKTIKENLCRLKRYTIIVVAVGAGLLQMFEFSMNFKFNQLRIACEKRQCDRAASSCRDRHISYYFVGLSLCNLTLLIPCGIFAWTNISSNGLAIPNTRAYLLASWMQSVLLHLWFILYLCDQENAYLLDVFEFFCDVLLLVSINLNAAAILERLTFVEKDINKRHSCLSAYGDFLLKRVVRFLACILPIYDACDVLGLFELVRPKTSINPTQISWIAWAFWLMLTGGAYAMIAVRLWTCLNDLVFSGSILCEDEEIKRLPVLEAEVKWSKRVLRYIRAALVIPCWLRALCLVVDTIFASFIAVNFNSAHAATHSFARKLSQLSGILPPVADSFALLVVVGVFTTKGPNFDEIGSCQKNRTIPKIARERSVSDTFFEKIIRLGDRSMTAEDILDFYRKLCDPSATYMPGFSPSKSTTTDVVRGAVIPMSVDGNTGMAYSDMVRADSDWHRDHSTVADCMVTHTWSSLFTFLVAAVLSDALNHLDGGYAEIVAKLSNDKGRRELQAELMKAHVEKAYWICVFCVNQHSCICHDIRPPLYDSVTGEAHKPCRCSHPKWNNDEHPDECEMNAFDRMMQYIKQKNPSLYQVIAVDQDYKLFWRVWCVAEFVEAHKQKIEQRTQFLTLLDSTLNEEEFDIYVKLMSLSVQDCNATREEDKMDILRKIEDMAEFNAHLQKLIFGNRGFYQQRTGSGLEVLSSAAAVLTRARCVSRKTKSNRRPMLSCDGAEVQLLPHADTS